MTATTSPTDLGRTLVRRGRQVRRLWAEQGSGAVANRVARRVMHHLPATFEEPWPVARADVLAADLTHLRQFPWRRVPAGTPLWINVIMTPPSAGSGGHTTVFRLVSHLEAAGHRVRLYLDDVHGSDATWYAPRIAQWWPEVQASVLDARHGLGDADAVIATAWPTAYRAYVDPCAGKRFYLVQDFEPWFHPPGSLAALAEATYRMGFHTITAGRWLADVLHERFGVTADAFDFGTDDVYRLADDTPSPRSGVVFHTRHDTPRRAYELGMLALEVFAQHHPDVPIALYGGPVHHVPFPHIALGVVPPQQLADLYRRSQGGLSLSFTNASLVPHEMLAAGCIPVVNDAPHNRRVLDNDHIHYADAQPHALARALAHVVADPEGERHAVEASRSVTTRHWADAGEVARAVLERELWW